jgi:4-hydroxythreonine-4-phosphate dehydrogenase
MSNERKPIIGITTGDLNGIGLELIIKTFSNSKLMEYCTPVLFASNKVLSFYQKMMDNNNFKYSSVKDWAQLNQKQLNVYTCWQEDVTIEPGKLTSEGGKYAVRSLEVATQCMKDKQIDGLVTAPIHKKNVQGPNFDYTGHTPYLRDQYQASDVAMMLCTDFLRVALLTEHVPVTQLEKHITTAAIISKTEIIHNSLIQDFGIEKPKIAILGLNPHAGDDGLIGTEEKEIIVPAMEQLRQKNILVFGPYAADGFFARASYKAFDCVLAMYHDQGLIPFKTLDLDEGVNYTAGLPIVRTSPDHGTAFDIAGKNEASPTSFLHAVYKCIDILEQRNGYAENTKNKIVYGQFNKKNKRSKSHGEEN